MTVGTDLAEVRTRGALASLVAATSSSLAISGTYPVRVDTCALALRTSGRVSRRKRRTEGRLAALSPRGDGGEYMHLAPSCKKICRPRVNFFPTSLCGASLERRSTSLSTPFRTRFRRRSPSFRHRHEPRGVQHADQFQGASPPGLRPVDGTRRQADRRGKEPISAH